MCGIVCAFDFKEDFKDLRPKILNMSKLVRHRGPDWSGIFSCENAIMAHERLAIVDPKSGNQPLYSKDKRYVLAANGEIYNHKYLRSQLKDNYDFQTDSDCEIILALYNEKGEDFLDDLNGIYAFALYDSYKNEFFIARDHMGIIPLYNGWDTNGSFYVASELKALEGVCNKIELFPPGHYLYSKDKKKTRWYSREWMNFDNIKDNKTDIKKIHDSLYKAVKRQLMSDVPYGVLLSGGLDSSVTSALAKILSESEKKDSHKSVLLNNLHSFSVGLKGSPDLDAAKKVASFIGTVHHEIVFTIQEGLDAIRDVIYHLETYDVTTVRASTPMYLMARTIKSMGIKMVLSGEGADELFGGYLYFHKAPNAREFHEETVRKLDKLHMYDCLRANKSLAAWGIEGRVPFLDKDFMDVAMSLNPEDKMIKGERIEKWILRKAFEDYLPESIVWRQKEQFSDGVGYNWIDTLKKVVEDQISDKKMEEASSRFPAQTPTTKEEYYYRSLFSDHFPSETAAYCVPQEPSVACSTKIALEWDEAFKSLNEPSGRAISKVHEDAY